MLELELLMVLMVRRRSCAVSNHEEAAILRDAAKRPLLRMRTESVLDT
jgi:hypothetical protein